MNKILTLLTALAVCQLAHGQNADTQTARLLCNQNGLTIQSLDGAGVSTDEVANTACYPQAYPETNSAWLKWEVAEGGSLGLTILPFDAADDIDFVLYRLPNGIQDCAIKTPIRCMVAGPVLGEAKPLGLACTGATGLRTSSEGDAEKRGCRDGADNFLTAVEVAGGEAYLLFINNFRSAKGIAVSFTGNSVFRAFPDICGPSSGSGGATSEVLGDMPKDGIRFSAAYPNPTNAEVFINAAAPAFMEGSYQFISAGGQILETQPFSVHAGDNTIKIQTAQYVSGLYFVKFICGDAIHIARFTR